MVMLTMHYCFTLPRRVLKTLPEVGDPIERGWWVVGARETMRDQGG